MVNPDSLRYLTIAEASDLIRAGQLSPVELTQAHLRRVEALNTQLRAFITVTGESAMEHAREAEREIRAGHYRGRLHGIPIAHKDIVCTQGVRTTAHSRVLAGWVPGVDATVVQRLRNAGAIALGKTSLHEFAFGSPGPDEAFPAARNPWNLDYAPGSSSSGSAAAVAAGLCFAATGTDTGGSIRHPASVCGIVGMKPTFGRVSACGVIPLAASLDHVGPLTRTVRDSAIMLEAMAGYDEQDPWSLQCEVPNLERLIGTGLAGIRIGVPRRFMETISHSADMLNAFGEAEHTLRNLGAQLTDVDIPELDRANDAAGLILVYEAYRYHRTELDKDSSRFGATFKERIFKARALDESDYHAALQKRAAICAGFDALFRSGISAVITPGREGAADSMEELLANPAKRGLTNRMYNLTGIPALTLPMGFSAERLPLGLQIAADRLREDVVYQVASAYESACGWRNHHPPI